MRPSPLGGLLLAADNKTAFRLIARLANHQLHPIL